MYVAINCYRLITHVLLYLHEQCWISDPNSSIQGHGNAAWCVDKMPGFFSSLASQAGTKEEKGRINTENMVSVSRWVGNSPHRL